MARISIARSRLNVALGTVEPQAALVKLTEVAETSFDGGSIRGLGALDLDESIVIVIVSNKGTILANEVSAARNFEDIQRDFIAQSDKVKDLFFSKRAEWFGKEERTHAVVAVAKDADEPIKNAIETIKTKLREWGLFVVDATYGNGDGTDELSPAFGTVLSGTSLCRSFWSIIDRLLPLPLLASDSERMDLTTRIRRLIISSAKLTIM